jgi:hypothetical protein
MTCSFWRLVCWSIKHFKLRHLWSRIFNEEPVTLEQ